MVVDLLSGGVEDSSVDSGLGLDWLSDRGSVDCSCWHFLDVHHLVSGMDGWFDDGLFDDLLSGHLDRHVLFDCSFRNLRVKSDIGSV